MTRAGVAGTRSKKAGEVEYPDECEEKGEQHEAKRVYSIRPDQNARKDRGCHRCSLLSCHVGISVRRLLRNRGAVQLEPAPCHSASIVPRQARPADVRPHRIHGTRRGDAHLADQRRAPVAVAAHAAPVVIDEAARDTIQRGVILQREPRPLPRERAARPAGPTHGFPVVRHVRCTDSHFRSN
jgi:hypothetical protein